MPTHCRKCLMTTCEHYISSALSSFLTLRGWSTIHYRNHPQVPLLPINHATTRIPDLTFPCRHPPRLLVLPLHHATTCVLDLTTPPPSPTPTPANLWNTATSLQIPQLATSGSARPPTNLDDSPKASWTIALPPPMPSSFFPSTKSHATNAQPMHDLSAVFARKNLNHIAPASQSVVIL